jgi:hypothetical protein
LADPTGNAALFEYVKLGVISGGAIGGLSAIACGGDTGEIAKAVVLGAAFGGVFGAGLFYLYQPVLALGTGLALRNAAAEAYDGILNGWNTCNGFNFGMSLLMVALGGRGLAKDISLGGPRLWGSPLEATVSNARPSSILWRGAPRGGSSPEELSPEQAQALINWVVENWFSDPYFRRVILSGGKRFQIINSSTPRYWPRYNPNLTPPNDYGAAIRNTATEIGPRSIAEGPIEILRTLLHEEAHHWMWEKGYIQNDAPRADSTAQYIANLLLEGWRGGK